MHVKRIISIFAISIVLLPIFPQAASGQENAYYDPDDTISISLLGSFEQTGAYEIHPYDWLVNTLEDIVNEPIKKPKDIYLMLYNQTKEKPRRVAMKRTFEKRGLTEEEKESLLQGKRLARMLDQIPVAGTAADVTSYIADTTGKLFHRLFGLDENTDIENYSAETLAKAFDLFRREFAIEEEMAALEAELEGEIMMTEIFADGDESNSGFDLLADLEIIDLLLFGDQDTGAGFSGPGNPPGANEIAIGDFARLTTDFEDEEEEVPEPRAGIRADEDETTLASGAPAIRPSDIAPAADAQFNPAVCYTDLAFHQQVEDFAGRDGADEAVSGGISGAEERRRGLAAGTEPRATVGATPLAETGAEKTEEEIRTPARAADWRRSVFCSAEDVWCFTIETIYKTESSYPPDANCIACHIEKINDAYNRTVKSNLVPSKATGNLIEIPMCKKGFGLPNLLNLNFIAVPNPIITPPNDDAVVKDTFIGSIDKFFKKYFRFESDLTGRLARLTDDNTETDAADRATAQKSGTTSVTDIVADITAEVTAQRQSALDELRRQGFRQKATGHLRLHEALEAEINQMNAYFDGFKILFTNVGQRGGPCEKLLHDTPICE